jgi:response regulator NasT
LISIGYNIVGEACDGPTSLLLAREVNPDIIFIDTDVQGMSSFEIARILSKEELIPVVFISSSSDPMVAKEAGECGAIAYLFPPFIPEQIKITLDIALTQFRYYKKTLQEANELREALETRKLVERAKGILMSAENISEQEAYRRMQVVSMKSGKSMKEIAQAIILASKTKRL